MDARTAGRFSFLLAIPAVIGATVLYAGEMGSAAANEDMVPYLAGTLVSMVVGYFSLAAVLRILDKGKLYLFAPWCFIIGVLTLFFI